MTTTPQRRENRPCGFFVPLVEVGCRLVPPAARSHPRKRRRSTTERVLQGVASKSFFAPFVWVCNRLPPRDQSASCGLPSPRQKKFLESLAGSALLCYARSARVDPSGRGDAPSCRLVNPSRSPAPLGEPAEQRTDDRPPLGGGVRPPVSAFSCAETPRPSLGGCGGLCAP